MAAPLAGLRVIDLSHIMAGPTCTMMLADLGADVIKVEKLPGGDDSRRMVPPEIEGESAAFLMMNRNKRALALDLRTTQGQDILHLLLETADIVVENYRLGALTKLGFDYALMKDRYPRLIWCAISGFGRTGPYADRGGFDLIAQAMSGIMSITGPADGSAPTKCGPPLTDIAAGLLATIGVLAAVEARHKTGRGQLVDTSLFEAGAMMTYWQSAIALATGAAPGAMGSAHPLNAPYQAFAATDGWLVVGAANQANWLRLVAVLDRPDLANDPRFASNKDRMAHLAALEAELKPIFARRPREAWLAMLDAAGVPAGPVLSVTEMHAHPQTAAREMVVHLPHARLGSHASLGTPVKLSDADNRPRTGAPLLGQHSRAILADLGLPQAEIDRLVADGVIAEPTEPDMAYAMTAKNA